MLKAAIFLIILIVIGAAYLLSEEANSGNPNKHYGKIIGIALGGILAIVIFVGYMFITYFK